MDEQTNGPDQRGPTAGPPPAEQRKRRRFMTERGRRRLLIGGGGALLLLVLVVGFLWMRCGVSGCPDVDMLRGYMPEEASVLVDREGAEIAKLFVTRRTVVPVDSMPQHLLDAFVAIEDRRFWDHGGVDWRRVFGAALQNVQSGSISEGSSTITMQLARNVFPDKLPASQKTLTRKLGEARVAREIESRYSKREIIELYLNQIYFGSGAYGIQSAAEEYFGKSASELTLAESAMLAALPRAPSRLNPRANPDAALEGRELVLRRMAAQGLITEEQKADAADEELELSARRSEEVAEAPYFVEAVRRMLEDVLGNDLYTEGYTIHTTLDLDAQHVVEEELSQQLTRIESGTYGSYPHPTYASAQADTTREAGAGTRYLQGAAIVMDVRTGDVLALVGGRDFDHSQYNRATQAMRQPGSAFKPFVYAAALSAGYSPAHRLMDRPLQMQLGNGQVWEPSNYDGTYSDVVSLRTALVQSKNIPTVRLANEVGMNRVVSTAEQFGLGPMDSHPAVVLGTEEVTPLQLTAAYAAFATLGQRPEPRFVTRVQDRNGQTVWQQEPSAQRVIDPAVAFLTTSLMQDVVDRGTGTAVRGAGFSGAAAGKTGTTQDAADVWFVGFTPEVVGTVWIGLDERQRIKPGATGGDLAAPVWGRMMRQIGGGGSGWSPPSGIEQLAVDERGVLIGEGCVAQGEVRNEYFLRGTAPSAGCYSDNYAYADTFDWDNGFDDMDTTRTTTADTSGGWWDRVRSRVFGGRDTTGQADTPSRRPTTDTAASREPSSRDPDTTRRDTASSGPIGTPVRPPPPRPDTTRRSPPDTTRRAPPDTTRRLPPPATGQQPPDSMARPAAGTASSP